MANRKNPDGGVLQNRIVWDVALKDSSGRHTHTQQIVKEIQADGSYRLRVDVIVAKTSRDNQEKVVISEYLEGVEEQVIKHYLKLTQDIDGEIASHVENIINRHVQRPVAV